MLLTLPPAALALTVAFVVLLVGFPAFTWWETRRAYRRAAVLLDSWGLPSAAAPHAVAQQARYAAERDAGRGQPRPADRHHHDREGERDDGEADLEALDPVLPPAHITVREQEAG